ncbi:cytosine/adenosine deaminase [Rubidibacter lacunae KORDI 51-2]|uniref:Cytosine/adenosine deaminase n=1 Tax=Rubidibacter lacunae KORDI 51-2 TaxID=582515 RepID=U5DH57_9CHRO|nr:nucleoside deaminase [Rubidibacter lacunae]ERN40931.1 cytosine/adenosine deaminase [Rubidibacter lacunae KORDI 51-2]
MQSDLHRPKPELMEAAIAQSQIALSLGEGGPFGAVVVRNGEIVARGHNEVIGTNDPSAHAEIVAIRRACHVLQTFHLNGCELYTSCEPCPMCWAAINWAQLDRVYYGNDQYDAAAIGFSDRFLYEELNRPPQERRIPMQQFMAAEAKAAFQTWERLENRVEY